MKMNRLGQSELMVSEIGLGCMSLGTEEVVATSIIQTAFDQGVTFFDTADLYDEGQNEEIVGKALKGHRHEVVIATKVGNRRIDGQAGWSWDPSKEYILSAVKKSMRRLGTDYIDLYQLHGGTIDDPMDETIAAFEQLKQEGWIREYGISSIRPNVIRHYADHSNIVSVMNAYSVVDRRAEEEVLPLLKEKQISVIARGPLASGVLATGRQPDKAVNGYEIEELNQLRQQLTSLIDEEGGRTLTQLAIRYSLSDETVATVIPGASSALQLLQNIKASTVILSDTEKQFIQQVSKANKYELHR
ncbi:aldo/keto reductase [Paenibacillus yanchengensis]|uniref:Aldo/keto reductase n=1 Tax=Paenibacillus yanchengensis TaxID=2035833 RepID=A0ABW4YNM3_9BACL